MVHSLTKLESCLQSLPNNAETLQQLEVTRKLASEADIPELLQNGLLEYIDQLQVEIARVHACIASTWFLPVVSGQQQSA